MNTNEEWRDIAGWEGVYQVSDTGQCRRITGGSGTCTGRIVKPKRAGWKGQYLAFDLWRDNKSSQVYAHRAVLVAFISDPPDENSQANHRDGNKHNNCVSNLEWSTPLENQRHRYDVLGKTQNGEENGSNKYSNEQINRIRELYLAGYKQRRIAEMVGIDYRYINQIVHGKAWKHLL